MKIFINPGHGYKIDGSKSNKSSRPSFSQDYDPGAVGLNGYLEATVNLAIAHKLSNRLRDHAELKIYQSGGLWRGPNDYSIKDICEAANNWGADCLLSIHANASNDRSAQGISTHYQMLDTNNADKYEKGKTLAEITQSRLISAFGDYGKSHDNGMILDSLQVLRDTKCPGVLVEIGYITNPLDEIKMQQDFWQDSAAYGLTLAFNDYLELGMYPRPPMPNADKTIIECPYIEPMTDVALGCKGHDVRWIQWQLNLCGISLAIDGDYGPMTEAAVRFYQGNIDLNPDGVVGTQTRSILRTVTEYCPYREPTDTILLGSKGNNVRWVQWHLNRTGVNLNTDGVFGPMPDFAVRDFQLNNNLIVDGVVGSRTRAMLKSATQACPYNEPLRSLKQANAGAGVCWVQWQLKRNGAQLPLDGRFGPATDAEIRNFQESNALLADGIVGPQTRAKLKE